MNPDRPFLTYTGNHMEYLKDIIRNIPDFPKPGIMFRDVTTLFGDAAGFKSTLEYFVEQFKDMKIDKVAGIEARGFILGGALAEKLGVGFVAIRKKGKLPWQTVSVTYELEYGTDELEIHTDSVQKGERVLLIDDLLATGGTLKASAELVEKLDAEVASMACIVELVDLKGREKLKDYQVTTILTYEGE